MSEGVSFVVIYSEDTFTQASAEMLSRLCAVKGVSCSGIVNVPGFYDQASWAQRMARYVISPGELADISTVLPHAPCLDSDRPTAVDFILDLSVSGATLPRFRSRLGIWRIHYGAAYPPAIYEIAAGRSHIFVCLERVDGEEVTIVETAVVNTDPVSYAQSLSLALSAATDLPARAMKRWQATGVLPMTTSEGPRYRPIRLHQLLAFLIRHSWAWVHNQISAIFLFEMWNVGIIQQPIESFLKPGVQPTIEWIPRWDPKRYLADPFLATLDDDQVHVLMEEFDYDRYQGYIVEQSVSAVSKQPNVIIDEQAHMSYPFPLWYQGQLYAIPESQRRNEVSIYRFGGGRWERVGILLSEFSALDSTVFRWSGKWWMMNTCQHDLPECKLYIWHAEELFGPWYPHALNPVKCDVRSSRPGGTPFVNNGVLYRPAQDSSKSYGGALTINRVRCLTETEFEEEPVVHLLPFAPYCDGLHTLSGAGGLTVIDGKKMTFTPSLMLRRLGHKWKRLTGRAK